MGERTKGCRKGGGNAGERAFAVWINLQFHFPLNSVSKSVELKDKIVRVKRGHIWEFQKVMNNRSAHFEKSV